MSCDSQKLAKIKFNSKQVEEENDNFGTKQSIESTYYTGLHLS